MTSVGAKTLYFDLLQSKKVKSLVLKMMVNYVV